MPVSTQLVQQYYTGILRQAPSTAVVNQLALSADVASLTATLLNMATNTVDPIVRLYQAAFNRVPDNQGLTNQVGVYQGNINNSGTLTLNQMASSFTGSQEFIANYGLPTTNNAANTVFIASLYTNVLGRTTSGGEEQGWINFLNNGGSRDVVLNGFAQSPEFIRTTSTAVDNFLTGAGAGTATYTGTLNSYGTATTYTLTTGLDNVTGQNKEVVGTGITFSEFDTIDVTGTNNSLTISDTTGASATGAPTGVFISGVQTSTISTTGSIGRVQSGTNGRQSEVLTYAGSTDTATSVITAGGVSVTATSAATDTTGSGSAAAAVTALTAIYSSLGFTVVTTLAAADAANKVAIVSAAVGSTDFTVTISSFAGTIIPVASVISASNATQLPAITNTAATVATTGVTYDISDWSGLTSFVGASAGSISLLASDETTLTLDASGAVTVNGGAGATTIRAAGAVSIGADTTVANAFTSVVLTGSSTTADIADRSGLLSDGVTVAVGSTLTSVSITGRSGNSTLTGNGINAVNLTRSAGDTTITNATSSNSLALNLAGVTGGTVSSANTTTLAIVTSASTAASTGNTLTGLTIDKVTAITVGGTKSVALGTIAAAKLQTLTITGTGGVTADVANNGNTSTLGYVTSVDTTGSTAVSSSANGTTGNDITIGTSTIFTGGAGTDKVTVGASTKTLTFGSGNDTLVLTGASLGTGGTAVGGIGTDTVQMTIANAVTAGSSSGTLNAKISGFERLSIEAGSITDNVTVDLGYLSNLNNYVKLAAISGASSDVLTIANLANNGTLELSGNAGSNYATAVTIKDSAFSTSNVLNLRLTSTTDQLRAAGAVTANGIQAINIVTSNGASSVDARLSTITLAADAVETIVISGNAGLDLTNTDTTITSVDASGITSVTKSDGTTAKNAFTFTAGALTNDDNTPITITGTSSGVNTISLENVTNGLINSTITVGTSASNNVLTGGAGVDTLIGGSGNDTFTGGANRDVITTGAGNDIIVFDTTAASRDRVTDFTAGSGGAADRIKTTGYDAFVTTTAAASAFSYTTVVGTVIEFAFAANSGVSLGDGSANSLNGTNLLLGLYDGNTEATITVSPDTDVVYLAAYQDGKAYIYQVAGGGTATTIIATEIALVGILDSVAVGALTSSNFVA